MKKYKYIRLSLALLFIFVMSVSLGLMFGSGNVSVKEMLLSLLKNDTSSYGYRILVYARLPRVLAACFSGMALSVSGVIIQGVLHNPLAGPNIIGVNSGAGFAAVIAMAFFPLSRGIISFSAFSGALLATVLIFCIASFGGFGKVTIILAGVTLSSILSAGIDMIKTINPDIAIDGMDFLIGGFSSVSMSNLFPGIYYILFGIVAACVMSRAIDIIGLGDEYAKTLGMNVTLVRFILIILSSLLAGAAVSFSGLLGFVGLIVPHIIRRFTGNYHKILIPCSVLCGGSFVVICDLISRIIFSPFEVPVGIIMSFIGGPFFLFLLIGKKRG